MSSGFKGAFTRDDEQAQNYDDAAFYFFGATMLFLAALPTAYALVRRVAAAPDRRAVSQESGARLVRARTLRERDHAESLAVAATLGELGAVFLQQGHLRRSEELQRESLRIRQDRLGDHHPAVATSLNNLALVHQARGDFEEAEATFRRVFFIAILLLGAYIIANATLGLR